MIASSRQTLMNTGLRTDQLNRLTGESTAAAVAVAVAAAVDLNTNLLSRNLYQTCAIWWEGGRCVK